MSRKAVLTFIVFVSFNAGLSRSDEGGKQAGTRLRPGDLDRIVTVSSPRISPDGRSVVFVVSRVNVEKNRSERE